MKRRRVRVKRVSWISNANMTFDQIQELKRKFGLCNISQITPCKVSNLEGSRIDIVAGSLSSELRSRVIKLCQPKLFVEPVLIKKDRVNFINWEIKN